jgi:ATP-binding cassette, subfamily B, bacterial PglK
VYVFQTMRRASQLLDPRRRRSFVLVGVLAFIVSVLEAVAAVLVLVLLKLVVKPDGVLVLPVVGDLARFFPGVPRRDLVAGFGIVFAVFFILRAAVFLGQQYAMSRVSQTTGTEIAHRLLHAYLRAPYQFHLRRNSAESMRNVYENVQHLVGSTFIPIATIFAEAFMVGLMLVVLLIADPVSTLFAAIVLGVAVTTVLLVVQPRLKRLGRMRQIASRDAIQHVQQGLQGIRDIKVAGCEDAFSMMFRRARSKLARTEYLRATLSYVPRVTIESAFLLFIVGVLLINVYADSVGALVSTLGLFAYAGMRMQPSLQKIANNLNNLRFGQAVVDELFDDFAELGITTGTGTVAPETSPTDDVAPLSFVDELRLDRVGFVYASGSRQVLSGLSMSIRPGESVGVAGHTGCGKSTLLDLLCGLIEPTSGRITVDGVDIGQHTRAWHRSIGVVHQQSFLTDDTVRRNIALGVPDDEIDDETLQKAVDASALSPVIAELDDGLDTHLGERGIRLSGGQRQRVALARALYRRPRLLMLDEATSALDNATEGRIIDSIERFGDGGMAVIAVAHRMRTIMSCDRVVFLADGRMAGTGTYDQLRDSNAEFAAMST